MDGNIEDVRLDSAGMVTGPLSDCSGIALFSRWGRGGGPQGLIHKI